MVRDFVLIKLIMDYYEGIDPCTYPEYLPTIESYDENMVLEHVVILIDGKLLEGNIIRMNGHIADANVLYITWKGHEFLSASRNKSIWKKARDTILRPGISMTFSVLMEWLLNEAKSKLTN